MKRSRARVPIGGQCVVLRISLRIKVFIFFEIAKFPYESHLTSHISETQKKIVKILETRPQNSKKLFWKCGLRIKKMVIFVFNLLWKKKEKCKLTLHSFQNYFLKVHLRQNWESSKKNLRSHFKKVLSHFFVYVSCA